MSVVTRTLAGDPLAPSHLMEYTVGATDSALAPLAPSAPGENFVLLIGVTGAATRCRTLDLEWHLEVDRLLWLRQACPVHLRSSGLRPASLLAWRFTAAALPPEVADLAFALTARAVPLAGPRALTATELNLVLGLRSCPVAPALRGFWASAKLLELLTYLLPAPPGLPGATEPIEPGGLPPGVRAALLCMEMRLAEPIGLADLALAAGQSPAYFSRVFSEAIGRGPTAHLRGLRMERAGRLLTSGQVNVTEAALSVGYQSLGQFSRVFTEHHGRPPSTFLARNNG